MPETGLGILPGLFQAQLFAPKMWGEKPDDSGIGEDVEESYQNQTEQIVDKG